MPQATCRSVLLAVLVGSAGLTQANAAELLFSPAPLQPEGAAPSSQLSSSLPSPVPSHQHLALSAPAVPAFAPQAAATTLDATALQSMELELGAYAPELAQQYLHSAKAHQAAGRHEAALEALAKAAHSERLQQGLYTPGQFEIVALQVRSHLAQHDYLAAFERQQHLLFLQRRQLGDNAIDTVPTQAALGDLYFDAFRKLLLERESTAQLLPAFGPQSLFLAPEKLTRHQLAYLWLGHAQREYQAAINTLHTHEAWAHPLLVQLEEQLIQSLLLQAFERRVAIDPANFLQVQDPHLRDTLRMDERDHQYAFYRAGIEAHERIIAYRRATAATQPTGVAEAMLALGDWHLLFGHTKVARQQYASAQQQLAGTGCEPALARRILQPVLPQQLPAFAGLDGAVAAAEFTGYVDVAFSIGKSGRAHDVEVLGGTQNADANVQRKLRQQLRRAPFRPGMDAEGKLMGEQRVSVRYHFAQI